jgi:hypothetical protein
MHIFRDGELVARDAMLQPGVYSVCLTEPCAPTLPQQKGYFTAVRAPRAHPNDTNTAGRATVVDLQDATVKEVNTHTHTHTCTHVHSPQQSHVCHGQCVVQALMSVVCYV